MSEYAHSVGIVCSMLLTLHRGRFCTYVGTLPAFYLPSNPLTESTGPIAQLFAIATDSGPQSADPPSQCAGAIVESDRKTTPPKLMLHSLKSTPRIPDDLAPIPCTDPARAAPTIATYFFEIDPPIPNAASAYAPPARPFQP